VAKKTNQEEETSQDLSNERQGYMVTSKRQMGCGKNFNPQKKSQPGGVLVRGFCPKEKPSQKWMQIQKKGFPNTGKYFYWLA